AYMPEREKPASLREIGSALGSSLWALGFPVLLLVGIRFGVFTPSESGAFACVYAIFVGVFVYKKLNLQAFLETLKDTARDIGIVMILVAMSGTIGYGIVYDQVPQSLSELFVGITSNPTLMVLIAVVVMVIRGMFIETTVIALLLTPILLPAVVAVGVDPVHFGMVMMTATTMGIMTPPVGIALYTTSQILGTTPQYTARQSLPFLLAVIIVLLIMVMLPDLVLVFPNLVFGAL